MLMFTRKTIRICCLYTSMEEGEGEIAAFTSFVIVRCICDIQMRGLSMYKIYTHLGLSKSVCAKLCVPFLIFPRIFSRRQTPRIQDILSKILQKKSDLMIVSKWIRNSHGATRGEQHRMTQNPNEGNYLVLSLCNFCIENTVSKTATLEFNASIFPNAAKSNHRTR